MDTPSNDLTKSLGDWSKWITGISLFSASGCIGVLVTKGVGEKNIINIKLAIIFFLVTIIIAWMIQLVLVLKKPGMLLRLLIALQIVLFSLSSFYLARWVWKFPANAPTTKLVADVIIVEDIILLKM